MDIQNNFYNPVDLADTGMWRLILVVSPTGMQACLRHAENENAPLVPLFSKEWPADDSPLLPKIENTVYDNPRLLDDYATDIIIQTPYTLQIPSDLIEENDGIEEKYLSRIYPVEPDDIFTDNNGPETCVYSLAKGLPAFLRRTIPGSRVRSHLSLLINKFRNQTSELKRIYVDIRKEYADIIAFDGKNLISASSQPWQESTDIAYLIFRLMKAYDLTADRVEVRLSGIKDIKSEIASLLREHLSYVVFTPVPDNNEQFPLTLAARLAIYH